MILQCQNNGSSNCCRFCSTTWVSNKERRSHFENNLSCRSALNSLLKRDLENIKLENQKKTYVQKKKKVAKLCLKCNTKFAGNSSYFHHQAFDI